MKIPDVPKTGERVMHFANAAINWMRANTIVSVNGGRLSRTPNGVTITIDKKTTERKTDFKLQFQASFGDDNLVAAAGTLGGANIAELTEEDAVDGLWYLQAKIVIDEDTGEILTQEMVWSQTDGPDTATDYFRTVATVDIATTGGDKTADITQYNYGPFLVLPVGKTTAKWQVLIL